MIEVGERSVSLLFIDVAHDVPAALGCSLASGGLSTGENKE